MNTEFLRRVIKTGPYAHLDGEQKFWLFVARAENGCLEWQGKLYRNGYGCFGLGTKGYLAHRVSYALSVGPIPGGMSVCHSCDNPRCVDFEHLFLGTAKDNAQDKYRKNRQVVARGEKAGRARLTAEEVLAIRTRYSSGGVLQRELADEYGVTSTHISRLCRGEQWRHTL